MTPRPTTLCALLFTALSALAPGLARAEQIDMGQVTCTEVMAEGEEAVAMMMIWIDGYLSGVTGETVLDTDALEDLGQAIGERCAQDPEQSILEIVRSLQPGADPAP